jgi:cysteine desulfurase
LIYLDYAAHMPPRPEVLAAFCRAEREAVGNANAAHPAGEQAAAAVEDARRRVAVCLGAARGEITFTSGATEANNLALQGFARAQRGWGRHAVTTPLEHPSVSAPLTSLQEQGWEVDMLQLTPAGTVDLEQLQALLRPDTTLVAVCHTDGELGVTQPLEEIAALLATRPNCRLHVDATQAVGKLPVTLKGLSSMSCAPHKLGGLTGVGVLWKREGLAMEARQLGGKSTTELRAGSPAPGLAVSAALALELAMAAREANYGTVCALRDELLARLRRLPGLWVNSPPGASPYVLSLSTAELRGYEVQQALARQGICVSVKSACAAPRTPSRAVYAVTREKKRARNAFRLSLAPQTTCAELDRFCAVLEEVLRHA